MSNENKELGIGRQLQRQLDDLLKDFDGNAYIIIQSKKDESMITISRGVGIEIAAMLAYNFKEDSKLRTLAETALECALNLK